MTAGVPEEGGRRLRYREGGVVAEKPRNGRLYGVGLEAAGKASAKDPRGF